MPEDIRLSKIEILIDQKRFVDAEELLKNLLTEDVNDIHTLSLLAEVYYQQDKVKEAKTIINNAIGIAPEAPHLYYIKSKINLEEADFKEAEKNINRSIELDPYDADYMAILANIKLAQKEFDYSLQLANQALEIDAENLLALNTRSTALVKLNKSEESFETIEGALREDPNNSYTHANYGWGLLETGDHKKALDHFKESLQNDPTFEYAQHGMLEAIKATNPFYRLFLKYAFWMGNLASKNQWAFIIGIYVIYRVLRVMAENVVALQPFLYPLIALLAIFALSTWLIEPISNLFLRFNKYGQLLLTKKEKMSSNFVASSFTLFIIAIVAFFVTKNEGFLSLSFFGFAMMIPFSVMFIPAKYKYSLLIYAIAMAIIGIAAVGITFTSGVLVNSLSTIFFIGFIAFQWISNFLFIEVE